MKVGFVKYLCNGNDYLLLDCRSAATPSRAALDAMCRREAGIGARGVVAVVAQKSSKKRPALRLRCFDTAGVEVRPSGDDLLCGARFLADLGAAQPGQWVKFDTMATEMEALAATGAGYGDRSEAHGGGDGLRAGVGAGAIEAGLDAPSAAGRTVTLRLPGVPGTYAMGNFVFFNLVTPQYVELSRDIVPVDPVELATRINRSESFAAMGGASVNFVQVAWAAAPDDTDDDSVPDRHAKWNDGEGVWEEETYRPYDRDRQVVPAAETVLPQEEGAYRTQATIQSLWGYPDDVTPAISLELGLREPAPGYAVGAAAAAIAILTAQDTEDEAVPAGENEATLADGNTGEDEAGAPDGAASASVPNPAAASAPATIEIAYPGGIYAVSATRGQDGSFAHIEVSATVLKLFEGTAQIDFLG